MIGSKGHCSRCGKRFWCGDPQCPVLKLIKDARKNIKKTINAPSPPNFLISWKGYPRVASGPIMSLSGKISELYELPLEEFIVRRASELRTYQVKGIRTSEEAALSINPVEMSAELKHIPSKASIQTFSAQATRISVEGTPRIPDKVFSLVDSTDLKAQEAVLQLKKYGFDYTVRALSTGNLGLPTQRKLVPTRWAITAVDSLLAKDLFLKIRDKPQIKEYWVFKSEHWDNRFWIIVAPWGWGFEMLERWGKNIAQDWELGRLKKDYAKNITGAYYSARMEILEWLNRRKKQGAAIVIRDIGDGYVYPAGVWHIREAVKRAFENGKRFSDINSLNEFMQGEIDWVAWKKKSTLWRVITKQRKLSEFW